MATTSGATIASKTGESPYRWLILFLTVLSFVLTFLCRFSWPPLIPVIVPVIHMSMSQAGAFMSAFYIGYVITQIPAGILADAFWRARRPRIHAGDRGYCSILYGQHHNLPDRFLASRRHRTCRRSGYVLLRSRHHGMVCPRDRGMAFGLLLAGPTLGLLIANYLVPALNASFNWQTAYHIIGIAVVILAILVYSLIKASDRSRASRSLVAFPPTSRIATWLCWESAGFCTMWMEIGFAVFSNTFLKKHLGFSIKEAGLIMVCYSIGGVLASPVSGWISDIVGPSQTARHWSLCTRDCVHDPFGYQCNWPMLMIIGFIYGFVSYFANPHLSLMVAEIAGKARSATATGISNVMFQIGSILAPIALGMSIDITKSFNSIWYIMALGPLVGILVMALVRPPTAAQSAA